uniref:Uncharacterized protein n=1 Tax=Tetradesmus obliquus TaxID=3088 RepID=A0A383V561_TETOB|eukprot:jgi/Sobl393_1/13381/SZX60738.1
MDLLGGYGSDSDDDDRPVEQRAVSSAGTAAATPTGSVPAVSPAAAPAVLFNPFADDVPGQPPAGNAKQQLSGGAKRPFTSVTGHSLRAGASSLPKASRQAPAARPAAKPAAAALLPPQLKGRSNVVTEDIDRLFLKRQPGSSPAGAAGAASAPAAFGPAARPAPS